MQIVNPATGTLISELVEDNAHSIGEKYTRARRGQHGWAAQPLERRLEAISRFQSLLIEQQASLAKTLSDEVGKPIKQAQNELSALQGRLDFFLSQTAGVLADELVQEGSTEERIRWEPLGVVANISAWNYPYFVGSNVFVPALLCGNTVLYKPSEFATFTGLSITELLHEAGVPADVFQCVVGQGAAGAALIEQPIDAVFFTGSYATGRRIAEAVAGRLVKVQLELGGKDPAYVCDDVDVAAAAESLADGAFYNTGQSCCAVERIYVHEAVAEAFTAAFVAAVRGFVVGAPDDESTYIGPLARSAQLGVLEAQVQNAVAAGARLLVGGKRLERPGNYFEPTVLSNVTSAMTLMREESFGPIIGIETVSDDAHAIARMNETEYGLTAGVYSKSRERAERILREIHSGTVYWNCCDRVSPRLPWTGRRHSGMGSTLSTHGIRAFLQPKAWHLRSA